MRHDSWNLTGDKQATTDAAVHRKALAAEFDAWADAGRGESMERGHLPTAGQALDRIPFARTKVFLDLGTGNGFAVRRAATSMPPDGVAVGLDVSPRMLAVARRTTAAWRAAREAEVGPVASCDFVEAPFDEIPLPRGSVDVCFSNEALYYAPDVDAALKAIHDVLGAEGSFYCSLDYYAENRYSHDWPQKVGVPMTMDSARGWMQRFARAGFERVETERLLDPGPLPELVADADDDARATHEALRAWKKEVGTLLVAGHK